MIPHSARTRMVRAWALAAFALLVIVQALDSYLKEAPPVIWGLRLVPLLVFIPGLVADSVRTYIWLCFVILMVFVTLVLRLFADPLDPVAWVAMVSILVFFNAAMMYARWRSQELGAAAEPPEVEGV